MVTGKQYYMLIGSLPALPVSFEDAQRVPISRLRLLERLKMLDAEAAEVIEKMGDFLLWDRQPLDRTDQEVRQHYDHFLQNLRNPCARQWIEQTMTQRTIVSALRRRRLGQGPPPGVGWGAELITRNWSHPDFRLAVRFPWIPEFDQQLCGSSPFELERMLLNLNWTQAKRLADQYQFSFEAVLLYLIRWEIVLRWTRRDAAVGQEKFEGLVTETMGKYASMFDS